jgi:3-hydroxy-5-methyl-1-naphthoate 3-O-methyltransferase
MNAAATTRSMAWSMERIMGLATGYWPAAALNAAVRLRLFDALSDAPQTAAALSATCQTAERPLTELLDTLCAMDLLTAEDDTYRIADPVRPWLQHGHPTCLLDALAFNADLYPLWGQLADSITRDQPALPPGAHLGTDPERTRRFALGMHSRARGIAPALLDALPTPPSIRRVLDVAAGPGTLSRLLAEQHPDWQITQFELPAVQAVARELAAESSAADRITYIAGDYHTDPLPTGFDAALLSGAIHQEDEAGAADLISRIHASLRPGGIFWLIDLMLHPDRRGPVFSNLFSLNMMLTSPGGRVFTAATLESLLQQHGFEQIALHQPPNSPYWILTGIRP